MGPVGVPKTSSASELWTLGPGVPAMLTITGARIAIGDEQDDEDERGHRDLSRRRRRQNSCIGERAVIFCARRPSVDDD